MQHNALLACQNFIMEKVGITKTQSKHTPVEPKNKQDHQVTEGSFANLTVEDEGDAFRLDSLRAQHFNHIM
jgi:hypothetical protein